MRNKIFVQENGCAKEGVNEFVDQYNRFLKDRWPTEATQKEGLNLISQRICGRCGAGFDVFCEIKNRKYADIKRVDEIGSCNPERDK